MADAAPAAEELPIIEETVSRSYVFNQYYWDFIKKVKDAAKAKRDTPADKDGEAKHLHKTIKQHYAVFDKMAEEHYAGFQAAHMETTWKAYQSAPVESLVGFFETEPVSAAVLLKGDLTLGQIARCLSAPSGASAPSGRILLHQYYTLFGILADPTTDIASLLGLMKQFKLNAELKSKLDALPDDCGIKTPLVRLYTVFEALSATPSNPFLEEIEQTSLGKLAKEIMSDINLDDLSPDMLSGGGGLMDMLTGGGAGGAGGGGLAKIISTVSQKMVSKMSSGELNQEDLLKDALGVAAKLPAMMPGGVGADLSKMGDLLSMLSGAGGGKSGSGGRKSATAPGGFDLSSLMGMMGGLGGLGGAGGMPNLTKKQMEKASRDGRVKSKLSSEMKRQKLAERLRKKVDARNKPSGAADDPNAASTSA